MSRKSLIRLLNDSSYTQLDGVRRSPYWRKQLPDPHMEKWFYNHEKDSPEYHEKVLVVKIPDDVVGHAGIAHGGFIAMLIDEALCFCAYPVLPHKTGVTANLSVNYLAPTPAGKWAVLRAVAESNEGSRKATLKASLYPIEDIETKIPCLPWEAENSTVSAEATQIVVEPKWYEHLTHRDLRT